MLLLQPAPDGGTRLRPARDFPEIEKLLEGGLSLADAVLPKTGPENCRQLALFGDV